MAKKNSFNFKPSYLRFFQKYYLSRKSYLFRILLKNLFQKEDSNLKILKRNYPKIFLTS